MKRSVEARVKKIYTMGVAEFFSKQASRQSDRTPIEETMKIFREVLNLIPI
ncbi:MAG: hypothetical protein WCA35_24320 [Kovacikia sp.]